MPLLDIRDLHLSISTEDGEAKILNGVDLAVARGEVWGLVGETGCGKSLTGLSVSRLLAAPPARYTAGSICFDGLDLLSATETQMRRLRGRRIGMIFQDPTTNLNPVFRIGDQMIDIALHANAIDGSILALPRGVGRRARRAAARAHAAAMLVRVGISDAAERMDSYPHQFSGGMRQRVLIAMALIGRPDLLIADEPTTALDVLVQAQILRLLRDIVREEHLAVLLITHSLGVVAQICSHVAVMYAGNVVESGATQHVLGTPQHPYTRALLASVPSVRYRLDMLTGLPGEIPNLVTPPPGCRMAPRCRYAMPRCIERFPASVALTGDHRVACVLAGEEGSLI